MTQSEMRLLLHVLVALVPIAQLDSVTDMAVCM